MSYYTWGKKGYQAPEYSKKRESKTEQTKSSGSTYVAIELSRNQEVRKILITICNSHEIRKVDMASIINTVNGVLLDYIMISHIFSEQHLFSLYYPLTNDKYITVGGHYYVSVAGIRSITLTIILPNGISKLTFTNTLYIFILEADLISLGIFHHKSTLV